MVIWITGLSGSGKTTLCEALFARLKPAIPELVSIDGDGVRRVFGNELGHSEPEREIQFRRLQRFASVLDKQALVVLVAVVYAREDLLESNRESFSRYVEVHLATPLEVVRSRDSKGLYSQAARGKIGNVVGVDIPWNAPKNPGLVLDGVRSRDEMVSTLISFVPEFGHVAPGC